MNEIEAHKSNFGNAMTSIKINLNENKKRKLLPSFEKDNKL
jgi:hypothetical protein